MIKKLLLYLIIALIPIAGFGSNSFRFLEPDAEDYILEVEADGGEVINKRFVNGDILKLKEESAYTSVTWAWNPYAGLKKDGSDFVSKVYDYSQNRWHATQTTGSNQPLWVDDDINGLPSLSFDAGDWFDLPSASYGMARNKGFVSVQSTFAVTHSGANKQLFHIGRNSAGARVLFFVNDLNSIAHGGRKLDSDAFDGFVGSATTSTVWALSHGISDYANSDGYIYTNDSLDILDSSFFTDGNTSNTDSAAIRFGANANNNVPWLGDIGAIIVYNVDILSVRSALDIWFGSERYAIYP